MSAQSPSSETATSCWAIWARRALSVLVTIATTGVSFCWASSLAI